MAFVVHTDEIYTDLKNLVKYGQIAMQLLQFNIRHFNVSNADTVSTKNDYRGIFNVIKVLLSSFVI